MLLTNFMPATAYKSASGKQHGRHRLQILASGNGATLAPPTTPNNNDATPAALNLLPTSATTVVIPPSAAPQAPAATPECAPPAEIYNKVVALGAQKAAYPAVKTLLGGILAGALLSFGAATALTVGGACPGISASNPGLQKIIMGGIGLPFGLLMVVVSGGELFTGNTAFVTAAALAGKATWGQLVKNWVCAYIGNIIGSLAVVALLCGAAVFPTSATAPAAVAVAKTSLPFATEFVRGLCCNWLVCMALWQAAATSSFLGKALACLLPVSAFVSMGLEHSVANMFLIPMGMALGAPVTVSDFVLRNLLPVTLGNMVGGAFCVAGAYTLFFGPTPYKKKGT